MGDFKPSKLTPLKKTYSLTNIAVFDIETTKWDDYADIKDEKLEDLKKKWHNLPIDAFLLCYYDHVTKEEKTFWGKTCIKDFLLFYLTKPHRNKLCFAHNGGKFDFIALYQTLIRNREFSKFIPQIIYVNGGIMILRIKDRNKNVWTFRDSFYLLRQGLDNLCKSFNPSTKKLKRPPYPYQFYLQEWNTYCMNDCKSLAEILAMYNDLIINKIGGCIGVTESSTALRTFRKLFLKRDLPTYFQWNNFIRLGFYGGRTEVFNMYAPLRGEPYYYMDVNSMYPSVMHDNIFPVSTPKRVHYTDPWDCAGRCGFMECEVTTPNLDIPLLPFRSLDNKKLLFPLGKWKAVYEFSMIEKALELGYKIKPYRILEFDGDYLFKEYVDTIYPIKQNSTGALREIAKKLGNCLFGKFGERSEREIIITDPEADIYGSYPIPNDTMGFTTKTVIKYSAHHQPAIAARVTALSELKLYKIFEHIQKRNGTVYYCDTDSVITDIKIPASDRLGDWGLEENITRAVFFAPKAYCYEYIDDDGKAQIVQKIKGFSKDFVKTLKFDDFLRALPPWNDYAVFNEPSIHPSSFKEINTRHLKGFSTVVKTRSIKKEYDKRNIDADYSTTPLHIHMGEQVPIRKISMIDNI